MHNLNATSYSQLFAYTSRFTHLSDIKKYIWQYKFESTSSYLYEGNFLLWNECIILIFWMCLFMLNAVFECRFFWLLCSFPQGILKKEGHHFFRYFCSFIFVLIFFDLCIVFNSHSFGDAVQYSHHRRRIQERRLQLWHERKSNGKRLMSPWTFLGYLPHLSLKCLVFRKVLVSYAKTRIL